MLHPAPIHTQGLWFPGHNHVGKAIDPQHPLSDSCVAYIFGAAVQREGTTVDTNETTCFDATHRGVRAMARDGASTGEGFFGPHVETIDSPNPRYAISIEPGAIPFTGRTEHNGFSVAVFVNAVFEVTAVGSRGWIALSDPNVEGLAADDTSRALQWRAASSTLQTSTFTIPGSGDNDPSGPLMLGGSYRASSSNTCLVMAEYGPGGHTLQYESTTVGLTNPSSTGSFRTICGDVTNNRRVEGQLALAIAWHRMLDRHEWLLLAQNPFAMLQEHHKEFFFIPPAGGPILQNVAGSLTPSGVLLKQPQLERAGSSTPAGAIIKEAAKIPTGGLTAAGALIKAPRKVLAGAITGSGAITALKTFLQAVAGSLTGAGALTKQAQKVVAGASTGAGGLIKQTAKALAGTSTATGALSALKTFLVAVAGSLAGSGALLRQAAKLAAGTLTPSGSAIKQTAKATTGSLTSAGVLVKQAAKVLAGSVATSGAVATVKTFVQALAGSLTAAGAVTKLTAKSVGGSIAATGSALKLVAKQLAGNLTLSAALQVLKQGLLTTSGLTRFKHGRAKTTTTVKTQSSSAIERGAPTTGIKKE